MKILIGTACVCVIGMTGFFALKQYGEYRNYQRAAIQEECNPIWHYKDTAENRAAFAALSPAEQNEQMATIRKCQKYAWNGY